MPAHETLGLMAQRAVTECRTLRGSRDNADVRYVLLRLFHHERAQACWLRVPLEVTVSPADEAPSQDIGEERPVHRDT